MQINAGQNGMSVLSQGDLAESQHMAVKSREARPCAWYEEVGLAKSGAKRVGCSIPSSNRGQWIEYAFLSRQFQSQAAICNAILIRLDMPGVVQAVSIPGYSRALQ